MAIVPNPVVDPLKKVAAPLSMVAPQPSTTPYANRPPQPPSVATAPPGPKPGNAPVVTGGGVAPAPKPVVTGGGFSTTPPAGGAAPAPTPKPAAQPAQTPGLSMNLYGSSGGTMQNAQPGSLESGLRKYIEQGLNGVTSQNFINRSKDQLASATQGQRMQRVNQANDDAIRRGLFRSGIPSAAIADASRSAQGAFSSGLADILNKAEQQDIAGRESAANQASGLLGQNRSWDQYTQQRIDQAAAQRAAAAANAPKMFTYVDPENGQAYQMDESWW